MTSNESIDASSPDAEAAMGDPSPAAGCDIRAEDLPSPPLHLLPPPPMSLLRRVFMRLMPVALLAGALYYSTEGLIVLGVLFVLVVPFEKLFPRHKGQKVRRPHVSTDISFALATPLLGVIAGIGAIFVGIVSLAWIPGLLVRPLVAMIPESILPFVGILLFDAAVYWTHRFYHEIPILWRFHSIHHSTEHLDWVSGFRAHPFDGTLVAPAFVFLLVAGFSPELTGALVVVQFLLGLFLHANVSWRLSPLHKIFITPEFHHWHHSNEPDALWTNYSTFLPIWDLILGTYYMPKDKRPQVYGVSEHIPDGIVEQLLHPLRGLGNPLWALRHPFKATRIAGRFSWRLVGDMKRSVFRGRGTSPRDIQMRTGD